LFILPHTVIGIGLLLNLSWTVVWAVAHSEMPATITRGELHPTKKGGMSYTLHYQYPVGEGLVEGSDGVDQATYERYFDPRTAEQTVRLTTIRFFRLGPLYKANLVEGASPIRQVLTFLAITCFWDGVLSVFVYQLYWVPWRTHWLCRWGEATTGTITDYYSRSGKPTRHYITYQFPDPATGERRSQKMEVVDHQRWSKAARGQRITVLYHPAHPERSLAYEFAPYRVT
jgi:hypothetical protein